MLSFWARKSFYDSPLPPWNGLLGKFLVFLGVSLITVASVVTWLLNQSVALLIDSLSKRKLSISMAIVMAAILICEAAGISVGGYSAGTVAVIFFWCSLSRDASHREQHCISLALDPYASNINTTCRLGGIYLGSSCGDPSRYNFAPRAQHCWAAAVDFLGNFIV